MSPGVWRRQGLISGLRKPITAWCGGSIQFVVARGQPRFSEANAGAQPVSPWLLMSLSGLPNGFSGPLSAGMERGGNPLRT